MTTEPSFEEEAKEELRTQLQFLMKARIGVQITSYGCKCPGIDRVSRLMLGS
jgi:hypothetical protein